MGNKLQEINDGSPNMSKISTNQKDFPEKINSELATLILVGTGLTIGAKDTRIDV